MCIYGIHVHYSHIIFTHSCRCYCPFISFYTNIQHPHDAKLAHTRAHIFTCHCAWCVRSPLPFFVLSFKLKQHFVFVLSHSADWDEHMYRALYSHLDTLRDSLKNCLSSWRAPIALLHFDRDFRFQSCDSLNYLHILGSVFPPFSQFWFIPPARWDLPVCCLHVLLMPVWVSSLRPEAVRLTGDVLRNVNACVSPVVVRPRLSSNQLSCDCPPPIERKNEWMNVAVREQPSWFYHSFLLQTACTRLDLLRRRFLFLAGSPFCRNCHVVAC